MKKFALTAVIALGVAAPAFAQTQLESSLGVEAGQYTLSQLVELKSRQTNSGNEKTAYFEADTMNFSASNKHNSVAQRIFRQLAEENRGNF
jgi:predicted transcriptional regulator